MLGLPSATERRILQMFPDQPLEDFDFEEPTLLQWIHFEERNFREGEWPSLADLLAGKDTLSAAIVEGYVDGWAPENSFSSWSPPVPESSEMRRAFELKLRYFNNHSGVGSTPTSRNPTLWFWDDIEIHPQTPVGKRLSCPTAFRTPRTRDSIWVLRELLPTDSAIATSKDLNLPVEAIMEILATPEMDLLYRPEWAQSPGPTGLRLIFRGRTALDLVYTSKASVSWVRSKDGRWFREPGDLIVNPEEAEEMGVYDATLALALWDAGERRVSAFRAAKLSQPPEQIPGF